MVFRQIIEALADAAFGLEKNILPFQGRIAGKCLTEHSLAHAAAVDIRVIKEICALLQRGVDKMISSRPSIFQKVACIRLQWKELFAGDCLKLFLS